MLALILSGGQLLVFTALKIPYAVLFALLIGFTTLVPYASAVSIVSVSAVLAVQDPRTGLELLAAAIVVGQIVDQVIQPRLMGSIGLQPAWAIALPIGARVGALYGVEDLLGLLGGACGQLHQNPGGCRQSRRPQAAGITPRSWSALITRSTESARSCLPVSIFSSGVSGAS